MIYYIYLFFAIALSVWNNSDNKYYYGFKPQPRTNTPYIFLGILAILIIGLRSENVGIDTWNYKAFFYSFDSKITYSSLIDQSNWYTEPGYSLLVYVSKQIGLSSYVYFLIYALVYCIPIFIFVSNFSANKYFSVALFVMGTYLFFPMSTMRQSFAMGCCILSFVLWQKDKIWYASLSFLLGASVHISAFIFLVFLAIIKIPLTKKNIIWWLLGGILVVIALSQLAVGLFNDFFAYMGRAEYEEKNSTGGWLRELFFVATIILCLILPLNSDKFIKENSSSIKALLLSSVLLPIFNYNPTLSRIYMFFSIFEIVLIPNLISSSTKDLKYIVGICYFATYFFFMYKIISNPTRSLIPYTFFWE